MKKMIKVLTVALFLTAVAARVRRARRCAPGHPALSDTICQACGYVA